MTACAVCDSPVDPRRKYCSDACRTLARRARTREHVARHRKRSNVATLEPRGVSLTVRTSQAVAVDLLSAVDAGSPVEVAKAAAKILAARITATAATSSESGLASLSRELRGLMSVVADANADDESELGVILGAEHRFGGS